MQMKDVQLPGTDEDAGSDELRASIRAAVGELQESLKNPKPDHFGFFHPVHKLLEWFRWSAFGRRLPSLIKKPIDYLQHVISIYDSYRRMLAGEHPFERDPFIVRPGINVSMPAILLIELFPPSDIESLRRTLKKNDWKSTRIKQWPDLGPALDEARSGQGLGWWRLGSVSRRNSRRYLDGSIGRLPRNFDSVEFKAFQIGEGLTAVMARIDLTSAGAAKLDQAWHRLYLPEIDWGKWGGIWPQARTSEWPAYRETRRAHAALHRQARNWLGKQLPGAFASAGHPQPLLDILLLDGIDSTLEEAPSRSTSKILRALGISSDVMVERSKQFPAMVLSSADDLFEATPTDRSTWSLWGGRRLVYEALSDVFESYGSKASDAAAVHWVERAFESYFIRLSITELLTLFQIEYAAIRDSARRDHARYRMKHLKKLRRNLVTFSLNLSSIDRDVRAYNDRIPWRLDHAHFYLDDAPWAADRGASFEPVNLNKRQVDVQAEKLKELAVADRDYREILTSAASLTSSMQSLRAGTVAISIALASLVVAAMTLLVTEAPEHSQFDVLADWIQHRGGSIADWVRVFIQRV